MLWLTIGFIISINFSGIKSFIQLNSYVQFPLKNVHNSIGAEYNATFESNFTSEFRRYYKNDGYILNLQKLNLRPAPNPYPGFIESQKVSAINLRENGIYQVQPDSFKSVPNVQYLDLSRNRIAFCEMFHYRSCANNLVTLMIEENESPAESLQCEIGRDSCFPQLRYLYLRKNCIRRINFSLARSFPSLVSLYLSNNEIDDCGFIRDAPPSLAYLYVENNRIARVDTSVVKYLRTLSADDNRIESICYHENCDSASLRLLGTTKLEILSLARNKISRIDSCAFKDTYSLVCLNLAGNNIETIHPSALVPLRALTQLNLDDNRLTCVPNLRGNWHLKALSLRNNKIKEIKRDDFSNAKTLQKLFLGGNCIRSIQSDVFEDLTWLQMLDLSDNGMDSLVSGWMRGLANLKHLDLRNNRFVFVHQLFFTTSLCLRELHLENNKYTKSDECKIQEYFPNAMVFLDSCSYNASLKRVAGRDLPDIYWEMSTQEKSDFSVVCEVAKDDLQAVAADHTTSDYDRRELEDLLSPISHQEEKSLKAVYHFRSTFISSSTLKSLNLSNGGIRKFSADTFDLPAIEHLDLSKNRLSINFSTLPNLDELVMDGMRNNLIFKSVVNFSEIPALKTLSLRLNSLTTVPITFLSKLPNLRQLDLSNNRITILPSWQGINYIETLNLDFNPISNINNISILEAKALKLLKLKHIGKFKVNSNVFKYLPNDVIIEF
ncbi:leucine-rich repeat-containing G-protein coupled receptor 5-like [Copidosoma floridanum]|uniref:leucine-rich repeat-containing G-protein coupled receptor 5-like n=1 Tax=Copidosoma floridanum TaxID=29053 RepID=UPI0006C9973D|nr:leucine-rich repeat-containing G-protein coupled receptor 5-like [Copidosoma floridanum]